MEMEIEIKIDNNATTMEGVNSTMRIWDLGREKACLGRHYSGRDTILELGLKDELGFEK